MKKCFKCGEEKPITEFYAHQAMEDGHLGKCKECTKADVQRNYRIRRSVYAAYERTRNQDPERKKMRFFHQKKRRENNPEMYKAMCAIGNAIRDGKLKRKPCEVCGSEKVQAHHDDYTKPLDVRWLCRKHHLEVHGKQPYEEFYKEAKP